MTIPYTDHVHGTPPSEHDTSPEWEVAFSVCLFRDREPPGLLRGKGGDTVVDAIGWSQQRQLPSITNGFASHPLQLRNPERVPGSLREPRCGEREDHPGIDAQVLLPSITETRYTEGGTEVVDTGQYGDCQDVMLPSAIAGMSLLSVFSFELGDADGELPNVTSIMGEQGVVYSSRESLYVASIQNPYSNVDSEFTTVHRFPYAEAGADHHMVVVELAHRAHRYCASRSSVSQPSQKAAFFQ